MGDETESMYRDDRARVIGTRARVERVTQQQNIDRVTGKIGGTVLEFFRVFDGKEFNSGALHVWVNAKCGPIAPGSADRIMRALAGRGEIAYTVINRAQSLYRAGKGNP